MIVAEGSVDGKVRVIVAVVGSASTGREHRTYELPVPPKLADAMTAIFSALEERMPEQRVRAYLFVINGENVNLMSRETILQNGDKFTAVPPVAGG